MNEALKWEFPGGKVESQESDRQALTREIKEELGIQIDVGPPIAESRIGLIHLCLYECCWETGEIQLVEHAQLRWLTASTLSQVSWAPADVPLLQPLRAHFSARLAP